MGWPKVKECCCYYNLETGAKIIGFLHSGLAVCLVIYTSYLATQQKRLIGTIEDMDGLYSTVYPYTVVIAASGSVHIVLGATLLVGTFKRIRSLVLTWVVLMVLLYVGAIILVFALTLVYGPQSEDDDIITNFLEGAAFFAGTGYIIMCVYSYYNKLLTEAHESQACPTDDI